MCFCFPFIFLQCSWFSKTLSMLPEVKTIGFGGKGLLLCIDSHHCGGCFSTWNFGCENRNSWLTKSHLFSIKSSSSVFSTRGFFIDLDTCSHTKTYTYTHSRPNRDWYSKLHSWCLESCLLFLRVSPLLIGQWNLYAQKPNPGSHLFDSSQIAGAAILTLVRWFHPQTQSWWLTNIDHHLAIAFFVLYCWSYIIRANFGIMYVDMHVYLHVYICFCVHGKLNWNHEWIWILFVGSFFLFWPQIGFSKDCLLPEKGKVVIKNKQLSEAVLESIVGKHGVSPAAKQSLATRMSELFKET